MAYKITCLGGTGEIGMNLYVYEGEKDAIIVDCGVKFADPDRLGVDSILPDLSYLERIREKLRCVIFTHGHEDHTGAAFFLLKRFPLPVYTGRFTAELLKPKLEELPHIEVNVLKNGDYVKVGELNTLAFEVPHSIPDTMGLKIMAQDFSAVHISDFRTEGDLGFLPDVSTDCLLLDSTNALSYSDDRYSEADIEEEFTRLFSTSKGRVFISTFSSNVERVRGAIRAARATGRQVVIEGAAMARTVNAAFSLGLLPSAGDISVQDAAREGTKGFVYLISGCQGEHGSALYNIAMGERKVLYFEEGDLLIFSSRVIPGNEDRVNHIENAVLRAGARVIKWEDACVHVSGHAYPNELKQVISHFNPRWFIPVHGEYRHLIKHCEIAQEVGLRSEQLLFCETGTTLLFSGGKYVEVEKTEAKQLYFDSRGSFYLDEEGLRERKQLARDGAIAVYNGERLLIQPIGFELSVGQIAALKELISTEEALANETETERISRLIKRYIKKQLKRRPVITIFGS